MDHRMPMISGADATEEVVHRHPPANVIMATADETVGDHAKEFGAVAILRTPFQITMRLAQIDEVVTGADAVESPKE